MGTNTYGYAYDPIGNRQQSTKNQEQRTYLANALNQYTSVTSVSSVVISPTYDTDGNMISYGDWTFTWNGENRLIAASNATTVIENAYDYMGRRITKTTKNQAQGTTNQTQFVYDGWAMIRETGGTAASPSTNSYVYGLDLSGSMQGAGTIGGILTADLNGTTAFCCYDANGNVTDLVGTNCASVAHYEYGPFGQTTTKTGTFADANPFRFSTKYLDDDVELYYYGYRYYNPELGRWVSRDPISSNEFCFREWCLQQECRECATYDALFRITGTDYCLLFNNPVTWIDFCGLFKVGTSCDKTQEKAINDAMASIKKWIDDMDAKTKNDTCCCMAKVFTDAGLSVPTDLDNNYCAGTISKFFQGASINYAPDVECGKSDPKCKKGVKAYVPEGKTFITVCPEGFSNSKDVGGLDCIMMHEMLHVVFSKLAGASNEPLIVKMSQCYKKGCKGYGMPEKQSIQ